MYGDRARRTNKLAELTSHTAFLAMFILHKGGRTAVVRGQMLVAFFLRVLHGDLLLAGNNTDEMPDGNPRPVIMAGRTLSPKESFGRLTVYAITLASYFRMKGRMIATINTFTKAIPMKKYQPSLIN